MSEETWEPSASERAELAAGLERIVIERDARLVREAIRGALPLLADAVEDELAQEDDADAADCGDAEAGAVDGGDSVVPGPVPVVRDRPPRLRRLSGYVARFAGALTAAMFAGSTMLAVVLAVAGAGDE